jgi:hypothetical protein
LFRVFSPIRLYCNQTPDGTGITISAKTSDFRTVRGVTIVCAIADEAGFWDSQGINPDKQVFQALRPAMATIPEAKLLVISSPYAECGVLFEAHHNHFGKDDSLVLVWQAPTTVMESEHHAHVLTKLPARLN